MKRTDPSLNKNRRQGSALIIALWATVLLSMLVSSMTFNMHMEAGITTHYRKRLKAKEVANAGLEWAKLMLTKSTSAFTDEDVYGENFRIQLLRLARGNGLNGISQEIGEGKFTVKIEPEQGRQNVNFISKSDWRQIFEQSNVPDDIWDELVDTLTDWVDDNDFHQLNGAESDDKFYKEAGYEVKNARLDTIDELLLIKGWSKAILYGGYTEDQDPEDEPAMTGFAHLLTTWGDGKVNINTASRAVLMSIAEFDDYTVDLILERRLGPDATPDTEDDGFSSVQELAAATGLPTELAAAKFTVTERRYVRVVSIGEIQGVRSGIWSVFQQEGKNITPLFWREAHMP